MSDRRLGQEEDARDQNDSGGPNLVLIYSIMAVAFLAAIAIALMIVFPFYLHRR